MTINIVWFKKDLRLHDHLPLCHAIENNLPTLLVYFYEPTVLASPDTDIRHIRFIQESLTDLNISLEQFNAHIFSIHSEVIPFLKKLQSHVNIGSIFSHEEIGNALTYTRDKKVKTYLKQQNINWLEFPTNAIRRGNNSRKEFSQNWHKVMEEKLHEPNLRQLNCITKLPTKFDLYTTHHKRDNNFQQGGETTAYKYLHSFLYNRKNNYAKHISKPALSRKSCSRISPYLTYGNLSIKQVYKESLKAIHITQDKKNISFFLTRIFWHCHFIQKFESLCNMEFYNINNGFNDIRYTPNVKLISAWENAQTGFPLIDASIICLKKTGYLNFRMRSMLVSFFTHHLWQPWQFCAHFLAKLFLDYEPGIHYPQLQMQAGTMGIHTLRIYNPVKQSLEQDADGIFITTWLPQLKKLPIRLVHQPWLIKPIEELMYNFNITNDYCLPIVDIEKAASYARENLWAKRNSKMVKENNAHILQLLTNRKTSKEKSVQIALPIKIERN